MKKRVKMFSKGRPQGYAPTSSNKIDLLLHDGKIIKIKTQNDVGAYP